MKSKLIHHFVILIAYHAIISFTFMYLSDAFIQSDFYNSDYTFFVSMCLGTV